MRRSRRRPWPGQWTTTRSWLAYLLCLVPRAAAFSFPWQRDRGVEILVGRQRIRCRVRRYGLLPRTIDGPQNVEHPTNPVGVDRAECCAAEGGRIFHQTVVLHDDHTGAGLFDRVGE